MLRYTCFGAFALATEGDTVDNHRQLIAGLALDKMQPPQAGWLTSLDARLERMPMAQPVYAAAQIRNVLKGMLSLQVRGTQRLTALEKVHACVDPLLAGFFHHVVSEGQPMPMARASQAGLLLQIRSLQCWNTCLAVWELAGIRGRL